MVSEPHGFLGGKNLGIFVGQIPLRMSGRQTFPYRMMEAMWKLTTRLLESRLLRDASDHRCEILGRFAK